MLLLFLILFIFGLLYVIICNLCYNENTKTIYTKDIFLNKETFQAVILHIPQCNKLQVTGLRFWVPDEKTENKTKSQLEDVLNDEKVEPVSNSVDLLFLRGGKYETLLSHPIHLATNAKNKVQDFTPFLLKNLNLKNNSVVFVKYKGPHKLALAASINYTKGLSINCIKQGNISSCNCCFN